MDLLCIRWVDPVGEFPRMGMYGYFTHGTDPPSHPYSSRLLFLPNYLRRLPSPTQFRRRLLGPVVLATLQGTVQPSDYWQRFAFHFACAYRFAATAPVLLRSRAALPYRAVRTHLGAVGE